MVDLHLRTRGTVATAIAALLLVGPTVTWPQSNAATRDTHARVALRGHAVQGLTQAGPATDLPGAAMAEPRREVGPQTSGPQALGPQAPEADAPSGAGLEGPTGAEGTSLGAADDVVVSVPVATGGLLGLSWPRGTVTATTAAVRTFGGSGWSPWYISPVEAITDTESTGAQRPGTEPIWVGVDVTRIQVRLPAKARAAFATAQLDVYTPGVSPQPAAPPARASAAAVRPTIISRAQWGADESLRQGCVPSWADTTRAATVHHTAGSNTYTAAESAGIVRSVMKYHIQGRGWCDIGYNALVDRYGQIFEGRIGGLTNPVIGAHSLGFNSRNFGISVMGDFTVANVPAVTIDALSSIIAMRFHDFYVNPNGTATLTSSDSGSHYPAGTTVTFPTIDGHRDFQSTACPGAKLYAALPTIRAKVAAQVLFTDSDLYARYQLLGGRAGMGEIGMGEATLFGHRHLGYASGWGTWTRADGSFVELGPGFDRVFAAWGAATWGDPTPERAILGGASVGFIGSSVLLVWSPNFGTGMVVGAVRAYWESKGALRSWIGFPVEREILQPGGVSQQYSVGRVWWSPATGAFTTVGAIGGRYAAVGPSVLGYPQSEEGAAGAGARQQFQQGWIYWSSPTGAHLLSGQILTRWQAGGGLQWLGFPTSEEQRTSSSGSGQDFERGSIFRSDATPAVPIYRGIHAIYAQAGGPTGCLGYPVSGETAATAGVVTQRFQGGTITFPLTGAPAQFLCHS